MPKKFLVFVIDLYKMTVFSQKKIDIFTFCLDNKKKRVLHSDIRAKLWNVFIRAASLRRCGSFLMVLCQIPAFLSVG